MLVYDFDCCTSRAAAFATLVAFLLSYSCARRSSCGDRKLSFAAPLDAHELSPPVQARDRPHPGRPVRQSNRCQVLVSKFLHCYPGKVLALPCQFLLVVVVGQCYTGIVPSFFGINNGTFVDSARLPSPAHCWWSILGMREAFGDWPS